MLKRPATELARQAIEDWLDEREREATAKAIAEYAAEHSGTTADLDESLEQATLDSLSRELGEER
jgi:hypothetical protein